MSPEEHWLGGHCLYLSVLCFLWSSSLLMPHEAAYSSDFLWDSSMRHGPIPNGQTPGVAYSSSSILVVLGTLEPEAHCDGVSK